MSKADDRVDKRRVTMTRAVAVIRKDKDGNDVLEAQTLQATDFVRPDFLDAYVADAATRWDSVTVSDEPDAGPAGYDGATYVPAGLNHPLAHTFYPATDCTNCKHAPEGAKVIR